MLLANTSSLPNRRRRLRRRAPSRSVDRTISGHRGGDESGSVALDIHRYGVRHRSGTACRSLPIPIDVTDVHLPSEELRIPEYVPEER